MNNTMTIHSVTDVSVKAAKTTGEIDFTTLTIKIHSKNHSGKNSTEITLFMAENTDPSIKLEAK